MAFRVKRDLVTYRLDSGNAPVVEVLQSQRLLVETHDCRTGSITREDQTGLLSDTSLVNPATGPIHLAGAKVGDIVRISIHSVRVSRVGLMVVRPRTTVFGDVLPTIRLADIGPDFANLGSLKVGVQPMVGFIAVTPGARRGATLHVAHHGPNPPTTLVAAGSDVYLPVLIDGAGIYVGDVHARMGDGEVYLTGIEVPGEVELSASIVDGVSADFLPGPLVSTEDVFALIATGDTLDAAARRAITAAHDFLVGWIGMPADDVGFFLSAACDLRVSQFLPGLSIHCRMEIPKADLRLNGLRTSLGE